MGEFQALPLGEEEVVEVYQHPRVGEEVGEVEALPPVEGEELAEGELRLWLKHFRLR